MAHGSVRLRQTKPRWHVVVQGGQQAMNIPNSSKSTLVFLVTFLAWGGLCADRAAAQGFIYDKCTQLVDLAANTAALQHNYAAPGALGLIKVKWVEGGLGLRDVTWRNGE